MRPLSDHVLQEAVDAVASCGSQVEAAKSLGISRSTLRTRLYEARSRSVKSKKTDINSNASLKHQIQRLETELRSSARESADAEVIKQIIGMMKSKVENFTPPKWLLNPIKKESSPGTPTLFLSDLHWGETVYPSQINGVNKYNVQIAHDRMHRCVNTAVHLLNIVSPSMDYPGIIVPLGGDMISGNIHDELTATNELNSMPAVLDLYGVLVGVIERLVEKFGAVMCPCVTGNHGRDTRKIWNKDRHHTSFDWLLYRFLAKHFENDKRVTFYIPDGSDAYYQVYGTRYLLTHGDQFRGGDSMIGALGPLCVTPETPVLLSDLTYRKAGDLKVGDELVGFDEHVVDGERRKFKPSFVTEVCTRTLECIEIETSDGVKTVASEDHPWLVRSGTAHAWQLTKNLRLGSRLLSIGKPIDRMNSWEAGYLAGVLDGEGSIEAKGRLKFSQQENACLKESLQILGKFGISTRRNENGAKDRGFEPCYSVALNPGRENAGVEHLRLLAMLRPPRIMEEHGRRLWEGRSVQIADEVEIVGIRRVGLRETAAFSTSTATFVANGILTHNTRGDHKKRSRNSQVDMEYDVMLCGHWHQYLHLSYLIVNGSLKGYDEFAYNCNFRFEQPQQALWLTHPKHGITFRMPVFVDRASEPKKTAWVSIPSSK